MYAFSCKRGISQQGLQTGALHRRAVVCERVAQCYYLTVEWPGVEPTTSRSLGPTLDYQVTPLCCFLFMNE